MACGSCGKRRKNTSLKRDKKSSNVIRRQPTKILPSDPLIHPKIKKIKIPYTLDDLNKESLKYILIIGNPIGCGKCIYVFKALENILKNKLNFDVYTSTLNLIDKTTIKNNPTILFVRNGNVILKEESPLKYDLEQQVYNFDNDYDISLDQKIIETTYEISKNFNVEYNKLIDKFKNQDVKIETEFDTINSILKVKIIKGGN